MLHSARYKNWAPQTEATVAVQVATHTTLLFATFIFWQQRTLNTKYRLVNNSNSLMLYRQQVATPSVTDNLRRRHLVLPRCCYYLRAKEGMLHLASVCLFVY